MKLSIQYLILLGVASFVQSVNITINITKEDLMILKICGEDVCKKKQNKNFSLYNFVWILFIFPVALHPYPLKKN